jgi:glutathionyl-hydroquinone reductase
MFDVVCVPTFDKKLMLEFVEFSKLIKLFEKLVRFDDIVCEKFEREVILELVEFEKLAKVFEKLVEEFEKPVLKLFEKSVKLFEKLVRFDEIVCAKFDREVILEFVKLDKLVKAFDDHYKAVSDPNNPKLDKEVIVEPT